MLLHQHHAAYLQEEGSSSSSSSAQQQQLPPRLGKQPSKQLRADLLPIPAFHQLQDMLQLLPGGQAYLDAAAAWAASESVESRALTSLNGRLYEASMYARSLALGFWLLLNTGSLPVMLQCCRQLLCGWCWSCSC
jgi:hypothetical protein